MTDLPLGLAPGQLVAGKYRIERELGRGGMGLVLAARHEHLDQPVALKLLLPEAMRPDIIQRFLREARAAVKIQSEHVARVFDVGTLESGAPFMVMEYLHGRDLSQVLEERGPLPIEEAAGFLLEAMEAIAEAHALGIVHRDLKPANLFLAERPSGKPVIKVLDFGISKIPRRDARDAMTVTTAMMGSPSYMSPEQMVASKDVDARSDVWSLGVVLYELLTHAVPFTGESMPEVVAAILSVIPEPLRQRRPDAPAALEAVVACCLEKEPGRRYGNLARLARALAPFGPPRGALSVERIAHVLGDGAPADETDRGSQGGPLVAGVRVETFGPTAPGTLSASVSVAGAPAPGGSRRGGAVVVASATLALLVLVGGATYLFKGRAVAPAAPVAATAGSLTVDAAPALADDAAARTLSAAPLVIPPPLASTSPVVPSATPPKAPPSRVNGPRGHGVGAAPSASAVPAPTCRTESYFDSDGNKHFKQVCP
jgi:tRNA A-37 threonylcarbamoyl transferase component Bud32